MNYWTVSAAICGMTLLFTGPPASPATVGFSVGLTPPAPVVETVPAPRPGERLDPRLLELGRSQIRLGTRAVRRTAVPGRRLDRRQVGAARSPLGVGERALGPEVRESRLV